MSYLKKSSCLWLLCLTLLLPGLATAQIQIEKPDLNKINYQQSLEKWAVTTTAKVKVNIDAVLDKNGLSDINSHTLTNLKKIAAQGDWHITQFVRSQDKSGLEVVHIEAEARLPETYLATLRSNAKEISKPGETYTIGDIDFNPSLAELESTHAAARMEVYNLVKQEIARLNQTYPDQHYFLYSIDFMPPQIVASQAPGPMVMMAKVNSFEGSAGANALPAMSINAKLTEMASVVIASLTPKPNVDKNANQ